MIAYDSEKKLELIDKLRCEKYFQAESWSEFNKQFFNGLASKYDATNVVHSLGTKGIINNKAIDAMPVGKRDVILDLCTGSGDMAIALSKRFPEVKIVAVDVSENMLEVARKKAIHYPNISFQYGDALDLPFEDDAFDGVVISFGLRNLSDLGKGILEMKRVVKRGGYLCNVDQGKPANPLFKALYQVYFYHIAPILGKALFHVGEFNSFRYLPESNRYFPSQHELVQIFESLGLSKVKNYNYLGGAVSYQVMRVSE